MPGLQKDLQDIVKSFMFLQQNTTYPSKSMNKWLYALK